ncbi:AbrB/MazE/SpoVT family DNA-binding domain-containing protein [Candidatus Fermentibacteria bacterium]|nr:AbrB/MazE/SpoVT family DNA-binding domain-containing protein [Candidatus Fermentibacteria bacterium]
MKSVVAERGQVTIPKPMREKLGIKPKSVLDFTEEDGRLIAVRIDEHDVVEAVRGCLKTGKTTEEIMTELRGLE